MEIWTFTDYVAATMIYFFFFFSLSTLSTFALRSEILHSWRWVLAGGDWAGPSGDVAGSLVARCSARSRQRHLDSSSRWRLAFANKLLAAAACLLSLCLQKRLGSVDTVCEEADTPTNNETKQSPSLPLSSPNISLLLFFSLSTFSPSLCFTGCLQIIQHILDIQSLNYVKFTFIPTLTSVYFFFSFNYLGIKISKQFSSCEKMKNWENRSYNQNWSKFWFLLNWSMGIIVIL